MKLIKVHRIPATSLRGARWKAEDHFGNKLSVAEDYGLNNEHNAESAAISLASKVPIKGHIQFLGFLKNDYIFGVE